MLWHVANTIKKFHIWYILHSVCKQKLNHDKQEIIDELFYQYHLPLLTYINHPKLVTEWKQNIDSAAYENNINKEINLPPNNK